MSETDPKQLIKIARENGSEEFAEPLDLGSRVRDLRKARSWTLEQAAQLLVLLLVDPLQILAHHR